MIKIERPGTGDEMRGYEPGSAHSANFQLLNVGKDSIAIDLKAKDAFDRLKPLVAQADIVVEQFRPGVMTRLGLSNPELAQSHPRLINCSITGYGQTGPKAQVAAHDLNYVAEAGLLSLAVDAQGTPAMTPTPLSDIGGGSYPAVINILLALVERQQTGRGRHLDVSMSDNVFPFMYWALGSAFAGRLPQPGQELVTGGSPRYRIYGSRDGRFVAPRR